MRPADISLRALIKFYAANAAWRNYMLQQWIQAARGDSPVWLDEISRACACDDSCAPVVLELTLFDGSRRAFTRRFPRWTDATCSALCGSI